MSTATIRAPLATVTASAATRHRVMRQERSAPLRRRLQDASSSPATFPAAIYQWEPSTPRPPPGVVKILTSTRAGTAAETLPSPVETKSTSISLKWTESCTAAVNANGAVTISNREGVFDMDTGCG